MWLRDELPRDLPGARIFIYGYDTKLAESHSFQILEDIATKFRASLKIAVRDSTLAAKRPLVFLAHSLGGLVLKEALVQMAKGDEDDRLNLRATFGMLFFGVPNQGMDINALLLMVGGQQNQPFLTLLNRNSGSLQYLIDSFRAVFPFRDSRIISFYETSASPTAKQDPSGSWTMSGESKVLVDRFSARSGRLWEEDATHLQPINRNHSDMVKFSKWDDDYDVVREILQNFRKNAPAVIEKRIGLRPFKASKSITVDTIENENNPSLLARNDDSRSGFSGSEDLVSKKSCKRKRPASPFEESSHSCSLLLHKPAIHRTNNQGSNDLSRAAQMKRFAGRDLGIINTEQRAFLLAAEKGELKDLQSLLEQGVEIGTIGKKKMTALHFAASNGNVKVISLLLKSGADIHSFGAAGYSPLHYASKNGHDEAARLLLDAGADVEAVSDNGSMAVHEAAVKGHVKVISLLLERGADVQAPGAMEHSPLHHACWFGHEEAAALLLDAGADTEARGFCGLTPLHEAALKGHVAVMLLLIDRGANLEATDKGGHTALHIVALEGHEVAARVLCQRNANLEAQCTIKWTALHEGVNKGHMGVVRVLLDQRADINAVDRKQTALHTAVLVLPEHKAQNMARLLLRNGADINASNRFGNTPLHLAVKNKRQKTVQLLLDSKSGSKARPNLQALNNELKTSLYEAIEKEDEHIVQLLLNHTVNAPDTALSLCQAAQLGQSSVVRLLLEKGVDVEAADAEGWTALHYAASSGRETTTDVLLKFHADVLARNIQEKTPLDLATEQGHKEVAHMLSFADNSFPD